ncbi:hypothetical protein [Marinifilum caeruleilacunae]|uniref:Uncharacterized protein n=1 Tax=Marinifilum caeruleilacunae TaxID=2499076 RepID=A0ABX1WQZ5_9BACT|nr:hypothetical protein [Marinifilum caeruleilacunae]NOU58510.1 hypothetical protein [Marinifilum caeruleilacunae]
MFGIFKKKAKELPNFDHLKSYPNKDLYFVRTLQWDWLNEEMIHLFDNKSPRVITMDKWPQQIYLDADGQKTIKEYIIWMANQYASGQIPPTLDKEMISLIENLVADGELIKMVNEKSKLPYYLDEPKSKQNVEKAYEMMIKDEYIKEK